VVRGEGGNECVGDEGVEKVCTRWVGVHVIAEEINIYSYIHKGNVPYPQDIS
jgi:hypothetical protein